MGSYVFRWPYPAKDVHVTGTFDDWGKTIQMDKVGDHWEKEVDLLSADEQVLYKFVVDDEWIVDENAPKVDYGHWNMNNILSPEQIKRKPAATTKAEDIPGAFPETPANEETSFGVRPIPASSGIGNPVKLAPGDKVPDEKGVTDSTVTTSKEDYEKPEPSPFPESSTKESNEFSVNPLPATSGTGNPISVPAGSGLPDTTPKTTDSTVTTSKEDYEKPEPSPFPETSTKKADEFSVNPLPATGGVGNPVTIPAGSQLPSEKDLASKTVGSTVTTSKEDYEKPESSPFPDSSTKESNEFSVNPIPASEGVGNPISLAPGAPIPSQKEITPHTLDSNVTTSKEDYEKSSSSSFPTFAAAGAGAGVLGGAAAASAFSADRDQKNIIPESGLPMGVEKKDVLGTGPFISSSGPGTTTAELASKVPLESNPTISSSATGSTTADLAANVPLTERGSFSRSSVPDASTSKLASELEVPLKGSPFVSSSATGTTTADLASKVPLETDPTIKSSATGATTSALAAQVPLETTGVPSVVKDSIASANQPPEAASSAEAVKEKAGLEEELLSKTQTSQATGEPASDSTHQTSYYGIATTVPPTVEKSMEEAHASPEAATETSAVAEKSRMEEELLSKVPSTSEAGEPAPTIAAATSSTAPTSTSTEAVVTSLTDGKTANTAVPDTDTSSAAHGLSAGEIAGGAVVGGTAAAGAAALATRHKDADVEPPRIADSQKPNITTERSPATAIKDHTSGQPSTVTAAASDSVTDPTLANEPAVKMMKQNEDLTDLPTVHDTTTSAAPVTTSAETSTGATKDVTSSIPDTTSPIAPKISTEGPVTGLKTDLSSTVHDATTSPFPASTAAGSSVVPTTETTSSTAGPTTSTTPATAVTGTQKSTDVAHDATKDATALTAAAGVPTLTSVGTDVPKGSDKEVGSSAAATGSSAPPAPSTPAKKPAPATGVDSPASANTSTTSKKKRHRLSAFIKKIFD